MMKPREIRESGLRVVGGDETIEKLLHFGYFSAYLTGFVSRAVADSIKHFSQRIVPYKDGVLYDSAFVEGLGDVSESLGLTIDITPESIEGTEDYSRFIPNFETQMTFTQPGRAGRFGSRTYFKYVVGYSADHAPLVHENPLGQVWRQDTNSPYPDHKQDHFLKRAYDAHRDVYSGAMEAGIKKLAHKFEERKAGRQKLGAPRLIKRTR